MRREPDFFGEQELALIYIARKLKEALAVEKLLTEAQVDYLVEPDKYTGGIIFRSERVGAFFYVSDQSRVEAEQAMQNQGFAPYVAG